MNAPDQTLIEVNVTQKDIDEGCRHNCERCPIASALNRHLKPEVRAVVTEWYIRFGKDHTEYHPLQQQALREFVGRFDHGYKPKPFKFNIRLPNAVLKEAQEPLLIYGW